MRLNRYLAMCGVASRRAADELIASGKVAVNGRPATEAGAKVRPGRDRVAVEGRPIRPAERLVYWLLHKPQGYDVTRGDRHARATVFELFPEGATGSLQAVGRLDRHTTGLLLLTNDGDLAHRLTHPSFGVEKGYVATGYETPTRAQAEKLLEGVELDDGPARAEWIEIVPKDAPRGPGLRLTVVQGRNRIVRRMCDAVEYRVKRLHRFAFGPIRLGDLMRGWRRELSASEVAALRKAVGLKAEAARPDSRSDPDRRERGPRSGSTTPQALPPPKRFADDRETPDRSPARPRDPKRGR